MKFEETASPLLNFSSSSCKNNLVSFLNLKILYRRISSSFVSNQSGGQFMPVMPSLRIHSGWIVFSNRRSIIYLIYFNAFFSPNLISLNLSPKKLWRVVYPLICNPKSNKFSLLFSRLWILSSIILFIICSLDLRTSNRNRLDRISLLFFHISSDEKRSPLLRWSKNMNGFFFIDWPLLFIKLRMIDVSRT
jgi:hypothetical protein